MYFCRALEETVRSSLDTLRTQFASEAESVKADLCTATDILYEQEMHRDSPRLGQESVGDPVHSLKGDYRRLKARVDRLEGLHHFHSQRQEEQLELLRRHNSKLQDEVRVLKTFHLRHKGSSANTAIQGRPEPLAQTAGSWAHGLASPPADDSATPPEARGLRCAGIVADVWASTGLL